MNETTNETWVAPMAPHRRLAVGVPKKRKPMAKNVRLGCILGGAAPALLAVIVAGGLVVKATHTPSCSELHDEALDHSLSVSRGDANDAQANVCFDAHTDRTQACQAQGWDVADGYCGSNG
jgi:hypothetical protein